jgi:pimeloyl-ACP methyl ester carboxylesterase
MRRWLTRLLVASISAAATCVSWWVWYSKRDYAAVFLQHKGQLGSERRTIERVTSKTTLSKIGITSDSGLRAEVRLRVPNREGKWPAVLLAVGLETGERVLDLVAERDDLVMLAVDYGWEGEFDVRTLRQTQRSLRRLKTVSSDAVPRLLLALDVLVRERTVDTNRLVVVGVSFGSYFAIPAAALDPRVSRVILVQGGGEMGAVIAASAPFWKAALPPRALATVGETMFLPLQPERWIGRVSPRRVTFIASRTDPQFPVAAVEQVYRLAGEPKELVWHDTPHVAPNAAEIIAELSRVVIEQLGGGHG